jgi:hypothetical protein
MIDRVWGTDASGKRVAPARLAAVDVGRMMMMVRAGHLGGHVSHRNVLACGWFCPVRCAGVPASVSVAVIGSSGAERAAMRKGSAMRTGRSASRCQSSATMTAATTATTVTAATTATTATAAMTTTTGGN